MINEIMLIAVCIFTVEVFIRYSFIPNLKLTIVILKNFFRYIPNKRISDHWKERAVKGYSIIILGNSLKIFIKISFVLIIFVAVSFIFDGFYEFLFLVSSFIKSLFYILIYSFFKYRLLDNG